MWCAAAGFTITYPSMPDGWKWANRIVPTTWTIYGLAASQLGDKSEVMVLPNGSTTTVNQYLLSEFGYSYDFRWWCALILFAYVAFFDLGAILFLKYVNYLKR